jgi:primosomal protein N' (replication factor Y)
VQTRAPEHHALQAAAAHDVAAFAAAELPLRTPPNPSYPPHTGLVRFVALGRQESAAAARAARLVDWLRRANAERLGEALTVLGPAACPISRLHGRWRWHVLVKASAPHALGRLMRAWRAQGRAARSIVVDRDPVAML